jgi:hypothetical protein
MTAIARSRAGSGGWPIVIRVDERGRHDMKHVALRALGCMTASFAVLGLTASLAAAASPPVETEPTLRTEDFKGLPPLKGTNYTIESTVPVSGFEGQFTVKTNLGDVKADGSDLLKQRVNEVAAVDALQKMSSSDVFVAALAKSTSQSVAAVGRVVTDPVNTLKGVPSGVGRFFGGIKDSVTDTVSDGNASSVSDSMGVGKARRQLAHQVGVDPYTTNPLVKSRLDSLSKAAFAGGVSLDVAFAVATAGAATAISFTKTVSDLAWQLPPEDIRKRNQANLAALDVSQSTSNALLNNRIYSPTMALAFVEALKALGVKDGANAFTQLAASAMSETEVRFYIDQLRMANAYKKQERIEKLEVAGKVGTMRAGSKLFVPMPVDYLSWTEGVKKAVEGKDFGAGESVVWLTGAASPRARDGLREARWTVRDYAPLD